MAWYRVTKRRKRVDRGRGYNARADEAVAKTDHRKIPRAGIPAHVREPLNLVRNQASP